MKLCTRCGENKPISEFGKNSSRADGLQVHCKSCRKITNHDYYTRSSDEQNPKRAAWKEVRTAENSEYLMKYLQDHPCVDCGTTDLRVLEFDHVRGTKFKNISSMRYWATLQAVKDEVDKCDVRCANCHRIVTYERAGTYRSLLDMPL